MYDPQTCVYLAMRGAGKPDDRWNKRFLSLLRILGYELIPDHGQIYIEQDTTCPRAPAPVAEGETYHTPSLVVSSQLKARLECPDE